MKHSPDRVPGPAPSRKLTLIQRPIATLKPDPRNARVHSARQIRQIAASIETFGFNVPVLIDAAGHVIAGHGRLLACAQLGWPEVPTISLEHLSAEQAHAFMIADNRLSENATWNEQLLAEQLRELSLAELEFSIEVTGFEMAEIDLLIEGLAPAVDSAADPADTLPATGPAVSQAGDLWLLGPHRVYCGSALQAASYAQLFGERRAAMALSDPPYNVRIAGNVSGLGAIQHAEFMMASGEMSAAQFTQFLTDAFALHAQYASDGALHYVFMDWRHLGELLAAGQAVYSELKNLCVWVKDVPGMGSFYRSGHELVAVFKSGQGAHRNNVQLGQFGRSRSNVWAYPSLHSFAQDAAEGRLLELHPTVKPVALLADAILDASARGEIVLDGFLGSGSTLIAAERTGRVCYGLELDPRYVDTVIRRWQRFTGQCAQHHASAQRFAELEAHAPPLTPGRSHGH